MNTYNVSTILASRFVDLIQTQVVGGQNVLNVVTAGTPLNWQFQLYVTTPDGVDVELNGAPFASTPNQGLFLLTLRSVGGTLTASFILLDDLATVFPAFGGGPFNTEVLCRFLRERFGGAPVILCP